LLQLVVSISASNQIFLSKIKKRKGKGKTEGINGNVKQTA
jgi:hypothetical protein